MGFGALGNLVKGTLGGGAIGGLIGGLGAGNGAMLGGLSGLFGSAPDTPTSPDYSGLAQQQYAANKDAARFNAMSGNPWFSNPYGTQQVDWSGAKTGSKDVPYVSTELTPLGQQAWDSQQRLSAQMGTAAENSLGRVNDAFSQPFDMQGITGLQDAAQKAIMSRLTPILNEREDRLTNQLANQGLTAGGEAYSNSMRDFNNSRNDAESQAVLHAIGLQPQMLSSALTLRNQPLNELNALRTGAQVQAPQFQGYTGSQASAAPIYQAGTDAGNFATDLYNQQMGTQNAMISGLFGLGSAAIRGGMGA